MFSPSYGASPEQSKSRILLGTVIVLGTLAAIGYWQSGEYTHRHSNRGVGRKRR